MQPVDDHVPVVEATPAATPTAAAIAPCAPEQIGPGGETPTDFANLTLTQDEIDAVTAKNKQFRVATFWQVQADTADLMLAGLNDTWRKYQGCLVLQRR